MGLPVRTHGKWGYPKRLLVASLGDLLPPEIVSREKQGFQFPMAVWMQNELRPVVEDTLGATSVRRRGLFDDNGIRKLYEGFFGGRYPYETIWQFVILELWLRQVFDTSAGGAARSVQNELCLKQ